MAEGDGKVPGTEGVVNSVKSIADGVTSAVAKIGEAFASNLSPTKIAGLIETIDNSASGIAKYFGQGREQIDNIRVGLSESIVKINKLGGDISDIVNAQSQAATTLGRNVVIASSEYEKLIATQKVVGGNVETIVGAFKDVGISMYQSTKEMEKVIGRAREIGVSAQAVSTQVLSNMDMLNKFTFKNGVDGLAKMAAQAVNLRVNINAVSQAIDRAFNPESAIEMAASLQRLGVAQSDLLDPLRLMDLAQNDPAELQNQIAKMSEQFVQLNEKGQFEIMPGAKRQLQEISSAMGMNYSDLTKMALSSAELGDKMSKIRFPDTFTEEQKTMIANMAEMGEGGEYKMMIGEQELGIEEAMQKIQSMSKEDQEKLFEAQKPKEMVDLASEQLSVSQTIAGTLKSIENRLPSAIAGSKVAGQLLTTVKTDSKKFADSFDDEYTSVKVIREKLNQTTDGLSQSFKDGKVDFDKLRETVGNFGKYVDETVMANFKKAETELTGIFNKAETVMKNLTSSVGNEFKGKESKHTDVQQNEGKDVIKMPGQEIKLLPQDSIFAMTKGPEFLEKMSSLGKMGESKTTTISENKNTHDITLTVKIEAGDIPESKILTILNRTDTLQALNKKLKETINSNGLMV